MDQKTADVLKHSLGDDDRDFKKEPLTQEEITAIIHTYAEEVARPDIDTELKEVYIQCLEVLKKHLLLN